MAFEMYGMLAGNVSALTGEYVKPAYGGEKEAFLRKVVTPIYNTIAKASLLSSFGYLTCAFCFFLCYILFFFPTLFRKLKGAKERKEIILSGETMMILMNTSGTDSFIIYLLVL